MTASSKHPILIVDDEPEILFSLQNLLRRDFEVHTAEGGDEAIEILRRQPIHVIMTDQRMPQMSGVELLKHACGVSPQAIRIIFTGYADIKAVVGAINEGSVFRYLTKPWDPDELRDLLLQAAAEHDAIVEEERLLGDLRSLSRSMLELADELQSEPPAAINSSEKAKVADLAHRAEDLLNRLDAWSGRATCPKRIPSDPE